MILGTDLTAEIRRLRHLVARPGETDPPTSELLANETERADDHLAAWKAARDELRGVRVVLHEAQNEINRLRALVGGRSTAPTREQDDDGLVERLHQLAAMQPDHAEMLSLAAEEIATLRAGRVGLKECILRAVVPGDRRPRRADRLVRRTRLGRTSATSRSRQASRRRHGTPRGGGRTERGDRER